MLYCHVAPCIWINVQTMATPEAHATIWHLCPCVPTICMHVHVHDLPPMIPVKSPTMSCLSPWFHAYNSRGSMPLHVYIMDHEVVSQGRVNYVIGCWTCPGTTLVYTNEKIPEYPWSSRSPKDIFKAYIIHRKAQGEPTVSYRWIGWVWEITGWSLRLHENFQSF